jgi:hypothetical protein
MPRLNINRLNIQEPEEPIEAPSEKGPWKAEVWEVDGVKKVVLQSDDFTHDVTLYVSGNFASFEQKVWYAELLAEKLNHQPQE